MLCPAELPLHPGATGAVLGLGVQSCLWPKAPGGRARGDAAAPRNRQDITRGPFHRVEIWSTINRNGCPAMKSLGET